MLSRQYSQNTISIEVIITRFLKITYQISSIQIMTDKVRAFRQITQDYQLDQADALKFIKWGKGDIQQALNYYYNHLEKGKIKYKTQSQPLERANNPESEHEMMRVECSEDEGSNAFNILKRGSIKQQKTHDFIDKVRKIYKLPIKGRNQQDLISSSQSHIHDNLPDEFLDADYLPEALDVSKLNHQEIFTHNPTKQQNNEEINLQIAQQEELGQNTESLKRQEKTEPKISRDVEFSPISKYTFCEELKEKEIYVGEYFVDAFCTQKKKLDMLSVGSPIKIQKYIEEIKTKKKGFCKKNQRSMYMRIYFQEKQIGRIQDNEVRIIMPLIDQQLIRVQFTILDFPMFSDIFKPMKLKANVYFLKKMITQPIVESFQPQQKDKEKVHQISALLAKLNLPILMEPLVRGKSKYVRNKPSKKKEKQSIDIRNYKIDQQQEFKRQEQLQRKRQLERIKKRNDPNFEMKQKSLVDMISRGSKSTSSKKTISMPDQDEQEEFEEGKVEKKIIQIDTKIERDKYSELIDLHQENIQPVKPAQNFVSELYGYQSLALSWMLKRQGFSEQQQDKEEIHPLWSEYEIPTCPKYRLFFNELTGQVCVKRPISKIQCKGGILADQMGLGKTVMMAALIVSNPQPLKKEMNGGTLVIVPLTLLSQWQSELSRHTKKLKVLIYYSSSRKNFQKSLHNYDVVISTYGTASHQFAQGYHIKKNGLFKNKWFRIILDEAHYIKGRIIQTSKAMYELSGKHRWCLTGTPIQNVVGDLFSLLHFIKYTPWSQHACWTRFIEKPLEQGQNSIYDVLKTVLKRVFLRRTKNSLDSDGRPIIELPPRISKVQILKMNKKQRQFYDSIYEASRMEIDALIERGILEAKYMQVLEMLIRLRQICCHPILFKSVSKFSKNTQQFKTEVKKMINRWEKRSQKGSSQSQDEYYEPIINAENQEERVKTSSKKIQFSQGYFEQITNKIESGSLDICIFCLNTPEDPVITPCLHIFCKVCIIRQIEEKGFCPICRRKLLKQDFLHLPRQDRLNINQRTDIFASTKMVALLEHLKSLDKDDKVVIFSQFLGFMDLIEKDLQKEGIQYVRMEGSNTHKQRTKIVKDFQQKKSIQVFLVSLKTAGVGLNLVAANKVFLMDPWWNPAVEQQAIERVHRIGQLRQVTIIRFIMDKTIQTRMLELNTEKKVLSQSILNNTGEDNSPVQKIAKLKYLMQNY